MLVPPAEPAEPEPEAAPAKGGGREGLFRHRLDGYLA